MRNINEINIKNRIYYFFNDMINVKNFDSNLLKKDKKSYKKHRYLLYRIRHESIYSVNPVYLMKLYLYLWVK